MRKLLIILSLISINLFSQNCPAIPVCAPYGTTPNGFGVQELNAANDGCLSGEHNSTWLQVTILTGGTFNFVIDPNVNSNDFDFGVWGPNSPCPPNSLPIRCSYAIQGGNGNTGLSTTAVDNSEGVFGDQWTAQVNVLAGQTYLILVDNFTTNSGFNISFGGTATLNCNPLPVELSELGCYSNDSGVVITWTTLSENNNWKFEVSASTDGVSYFPIGTLYSSNPNTSQTSFYRLVDSKAAEGYNYYKLTQIDFNGQHEVYGPTVCYYEKPKPICIQYYDVLGQEVINPTNGVYIRKITYCDKVVYDKVYINGDQRNN